MKRQTSLVVLLTVTALAGGVLSAAPAGATPPTRHTFTFQSTTVDDTSCSFPITDSLRTTGTQTNFFDSEGNLVTGRFRFVIVGTDRAKGVTLQFVNRHDSVVNLETGTHADTGLFALIKLPGGGVVIRAAGRLVFDADDNVIFEAGPHPFLHGDTAAYCAAFG